MLVWVSLSEFDEFKIKTWKSLDPGKSHVGVSESLWIWQIQIQNFKNHRTREIACWCGWVFLNLTNSKSILEKSHSWILWQYYYTIHIMTKLSYHTFISWKFINKYLKKVNLWISQQYILWPNMMSFKGYITYMISGGGVYTLLDLLI